MDKKSVGCGKPLSNSFFPHLVCGEINLKGELCSDCKPVSVPEKDNQNDSVPEKTVQKGCGKFFYVIRDGEKNYHHCGKKFYGIIQLCKKCKPNHSSRNKPEEGRGRSEVSSGTNSCQQDELETDENSHTSVKTVRRRTAGTSSLSDKIFTSETKGYVPVPCIAKEDVKEAVKRLFKIVDKEIGLETTKGKRIVDGFNNELGKELT